MDEKLKKAAGELSEQTGKAALLEKAKILNAEDIKNAKEIGSMVKQKSGKRSKKKNPMRIIVILGVLCVVGIFFRMSGSGGSGYEKILGMDKSAVEKKYGDYLQRMWLRRNHSGK